MRIGISAFQSEMSHLVICVIEKLTYSEIIKNRLNQVKSISNYFNKFLRNFQCVRHGPWLKDTATNPDLVKVIF